MSPPSSAASAESAPGNDSPCIHGRSFPVTDLSNGDAQYRIVLCRVAVVTEGEGIGMLKKGILQRVEESQNL